jgi:hypothetical protein
MNEQIRKRGTNKAARRPGIDADPVAAVHRRFVSVMEQRLASVEAQTRASYLAVMTSLTAKLEVPGKPLSETIRELMAEAGPLLLTVMRS